MTILKKALLGWGMLAWAWTGCGPDVDPDVVARIGERKITLEELCQFRGDATANERGYEQRSAPREETSTTPLRRRLLRVR